MVVRVHDDDVMYIPIKLENMQLCGLFSLVSIKKKLSQHLFYFFLLIKTVANSL